MLTKYPKLFMTIFVFLGGFAGLLFGCVLALFIGTTKPVEKSSIPNTPLPNIVIRAITITIDPERRDELFTQLEDFADEWRYAVLIAPIDSSENEYIVKFYRIDMKMAGSYDADTGVLELDFYQTNAVSKYHLPERYFDDELVDLKRLINEIPNSTYLVQQ
jgi:hypothetical protein